MEPWNIFAIVLSVCVIAFVGFLIPVLLQLKQTMKKAENFMDILENEVEPVINNVEGITGNIEGITDVANNYAHKSKNEPGLLENVKDSVKDNSEIVKNYVTKYSKALSAGVKAGVNNYKEKEIESNLPIKTHNLKLPVKRNGSRDPVIVDHISK